VLLRIEKAEGASLCSGVAVERKRVLTAAHCVADALRITVVYGAEPENTPLDSIDAMYWTPHGAYDRAASRYLHDVGTVDLQVNLPDEIPLAQLATEADLPIPGTRLERIGFGPREGKARRTWTDPLLVRAEHEGALILEDRHAVAGDSGGPIFVRTPHGLRLLALHSTLEGETRCYGVVLVNR
jgi:V8-like Glu-specific endopeptidase